MSNQIDFKAIRRMPKDTSKTGASPAAVEDVKFLHRLNRILILKGTAGIGPTANRHPYPGQRGIHPTSQGFPSETPKR